jgi:hypothetical protein
VSQLLRRQRQDCEFEFKGNPSKFSETLCQKQNTNKEAGSVAQVVEGFSSMQKALRSTPNTT